MTQTNSFLMSTLQALLLLTFYLKTYDFIPGILDPSRLHSSQVASSGGSRKPFLALMHDCVRM